MGKFRTARKRYEHANRVSLRSIENGKERKFAPRLAHRAPKGEHGLSRAEREAIQTPREEESS